MAGLLETVRLDKWLWQARFFKTRTLCAEVIASGHVRVDGAKVTKPGRAVAVGHTLTFRQGSQVRVVRIRELGTRRGPASEAQALYIELGGPPERQPTALE